MWPMDKSRHPLIHGATVTSLGTLTSRILGMVRDMATAAVLGMSGGGVMDAFAIAFRVPNLFRRLFGEGALAASYLPAFSAQWERDRRGAWQLASVMLTWLAILLVVLVITGEVLCAVAWHRWGHLSGPRLLIGLAAVMLPYVLFVCLAAQLAATLHAVGHFAVPAFVPALLNVCWLVALAVVAPHFAPDRHAQVYVVAAAVVLAGPLQAGVQLAVLRRVGFRFEYCWAAAQGQLQKILRAMAPTIVGLTITQINTMVDSLLAWSLAAVPGGPLRVAWLPGQPAYPMQQGAAAAIYYGERLYQFPLGLLGAAVATAIFPLLSRHAARGDRTQLAADLTLGLRLVLFLALPAGVGLMVLARPLAELLFQRGQFTAEDAVRTGRMIGCYSASVWAYCGLPVVIRGFYALSDRITPLRIGLVAMGVNLVMNLVLIWPLAEAGLAVATATTAALQLVLLVALFSGRHVRLDWTALAGTAARTAFATVLMGGVAGGLLWLMPAEAGLAPRLVRALVP
ncbi:MAG TPA: murein biosynthesis integral membrane protein MurJ, partial [Planctomycetaceae bacterium]|nr:murein biosynthesis integral membrane protein MurJ [Planctomycetaceae bacterium]